MILPVGRTEAALAQDPGAAQLDHPRREVQVAPLGRHAVQLDERHLDLGVAIDAFAAVRAELAIDRVGRPNGDIEQPVVAERAVPGNGGLDEVADVVQLVTPREVLVFAARGDDLDERVEVAVGPLRGPDQADRLIRRRRPAPRSGPRPSSQPTASSHL